MSSHFACIGFPVQDVDAYWKLARRAAEEGERAAAADGSALARWAPGGDGETWAHVNPSGEVVGAVPFYSTGLANRIAVIGTGDDPDEEMEGWIDGWLEPVEEGEPLSGAFPLRPDLLNYAVARARLISFPTPQRVELVALAHEAELFDNEAGYARAPGDVYRIPLGSFTSAAHFGADEDTEAVQESAALFSGRIVSAQAQVNPVTGARFWWIQVMPHGATLHVFADQETLGGEPATGRVLSGSFWMLGKLL